MRSSNLTGCDRTNFSATWRPSSKHRDGELTVIPVIVDAITSWLASIYIILGFRYGYSWLSAFGPVLLSAHSQASHRLMYTKNWS